MPEFRIASIGEVPPGQGRTIRVEGLQIALFNVDGEFHAIDDACPHMQADLSCGRLEDRIVTCSWHGWQFDLTTGNCLTVEWARVRRYPLRVEGDEIFLTVEPEPAPEDEEEEELPEILWKNPHG